MRRTYWFLIFLIITNAIDIGVIFINLSLGMWIYGSLFILFALMALSFDKFPNSNWTKWWNIEYNKKEI